MIKQIIYRITLYLVYYGLLPEEKKLNYDNFELTFFDDFDGKELNTEKWASTQDWGCDIECDNKIQWFIKDSIKIKDSVLTITLNKKKVCRWPEKKQNCIYRDQDNISALICSQEEKTWQRYGRFEMKCKIPETIGYLTSFWLNSPTSTTPEIDIFEFSDNNIEQFSCGYIFGNDNIQSLNYAIKSKIKPIKVKGWNTYTLDWTPKKLTWYFNGYKIMSIKNVGIPQSPMYVSINFATKVNSIIGMNKMLIDWVRVYQYKS